MRTVPAALLRLALPMLVGLAILFGTRSAEARTRFINTDDEILDIGPIPDAELELLKLEEGGYDRVGFYYKRVAILGADLWSWSGTLVFYRRNPVVEVQGYRTVETTYYAEIPESVVDRYGWTTPIEYRIPVGLLVALCLAEFAFIARKRRNAKRVLVVGIGLVVFSFGLFLVGLTWQIAFPLLLGLFHIVIALPIFQPASNHDAAMAMSPLVEDEPPPYKKPQPDDDEPRGPMLPPAPSFEKDPFRGPPQPPPIVVKRPPTAPAAAPVVRDEKAEGPKLLR